MSAGWNGDHATEIRDTADRRGARRASKSLQRSFLSCYPVQASSSPMSPMGDPHQHKRKINDVSKRDRQRGQVLEVPVQEVSYRGGYRRRTDVDG